MNGHTGLPEGPWLDGTRHSFVFLGEAGSGKSEIAISFARALATWPACWRRNPAGRSTSSTWT